MMTFGRVVTSLVFFLLFTWSARAQEARGSIAGKVADSQGAIVAGAAILVTNIETNAVVRTRANESGYFEATLLNPGQYSVTAEATGFKRSIHSGLTLNVAGRLDLTFELELVLLCYK